MKNKPAHRWMLLSMGCLMALAANATAADTENCMLCHRYPGLGRVDESGDRIHLYSVDPNYYERGLGPHARLKCTDCHQRSEVEVIPHQPVSAVNCTTACHLNPPGNIALTFSHDAIHDVVNSSVHTDEVLAESNELLGKPLHAEQSNCLLCHDEPTFLQKGETWLPHASPVRRCNACHQGQLELDTPQFAFQHVASRGKPAWNHENTVRACAVCHSNEAIREQFELPDATASYLASFHGKAVMLGNDATAGCLNCHTHELDNPHRILGKEDELSSTNPIHLADTCRTAGCHPTAGVGVSTAAVHLNMATSRGIEFFIGALFILLIMATFGPSVVLQALEMLQIVVGRTDPRQHDREALTHQLMNSHEGREKLTRFTLHQRVQHWILAVCFTSLVLSGFPIKFADREWAHWLVNTLGGLSAARNLHRYAGAALIVGFTYHLLYIFITAIAEKRRTGKGLIRTFLDLPMMTNLTEVKQFLHQLAYLLFLEKTRPAGDRFTLKEKFEYFGVFWGSMLLGVTGLLMWFNAWTTEHLTGRILTLALIVHSFEAFLALLHVGVIHMIGVIFSPLSFPVSQAMFTGETPIEEMAETHAAMIEQAAAELKLDTKGGATHD